jgi:hypothetical protein
MPSHRVNRPRSAVVAFVVAAIPVLQATSAVAQTPGARFGHGMSYHAGTGQTIVFGGERTVEGRTRLGDTWSWNGVQWARVDAPGPQPRMDIAMVYDSARDRIVLFGGSGADAVDLTDTWEWDGRAWSKRDDVGPGRRIHPVMAYDATRQRVVLFGGAGKDDWLSDTWEWDGTRWERRATEGPKFVASMAYDATRKAVVALTLPAQDGSPADGMAMWNGQAWTPITANPIPPVTPLEPLLSATAPNALIAYRSNYHAGTAATWLWNGSAWTSDSSAGPGKLLAYQAAFDSRRGRMVVYGGLVPGERATDALWERDARGWERR